MNKKALEKEDRWAWVDIGDPFPENPVRVKGEMNMYVALWYKHGKAIFGRAWNNGGVLECSFPYNGKELTGRKDLGGKIQVLTNEGDFAKNGYWYDWVPFKDRRQEHLKAIFCDQCSPIYTKSKKGDALVGNVYLPTEKASVSYEGRADDFEGSNVVGAMLIPAKNVKNPMGDKEVDEGLGQMIVELGGEFGQDLWCDVRVGDDMPKFTVLGGGKKLKYGDGDGETKVSHMVALWYQHGIPVMGRAWAGEDGKIQASFGWNGVEYTKCGSFQILRHHISKSHGFEYTWLPYHKLHPTNKNEEGWEKVHVKNISPCVSVTSDGHERLGKINMKDEIAGYGYQGTEHQTIGPNCKDFLVLARRDVATS